MSSVTYYYGGTLGDSFIVFCKLYELRQRVSNPIKVFRVTSHEELDPVINSLFSLLENVTHQSIKCNSIQEEMSTLRSFSDENSLLSTVWDGNDWSEPGAGWCETDADGIKMEPFPNISLPGSSALLKEDKEPITISIQLASGKKGENYKQLSYLWIILLIYRISKIKKPIKLVLLGTNIKLPLWFKHLVKSFPFTLILVNKTSFREWLSLIKATDFFITPEGFSAFFAMSQRVKCLVFYSDYQIIKRVHPDWRNGNILISVGWSNFKSRIRYRFNKLVFGHSQKLWPLPPEQVYSLIHSQFSYK